MINNAGLAIDTPFPTMTREQWVKVTRTTLDGFFHVTQPLVMPMVRRRWGRIVNVSSVAAVGPGYSPTAYAIAKAGVLHLTKCAATDLAQHGIRVNAVQPGFINTNIFTASLEIPDAVKDQAKAMIAQMSSNAQPVARGGQPDDIANAVAFLASEEAGFMTGASMIVDGGITLGPRHSWDPEEAGAFEALTALEEQVKAAAQQTT